MKLKEFVTMEDKMKEGRYFIRERWNMSGNIETYTEEDNPSNIVKDLKSVKKWIEQWIENWKESAEENEYKFLGFTTDYTTFCRLRIDRGSLDFGGTKIKQIDHFSLKVIDSKSKKPKVIKGK